MCLEIGNKVAVLDDVIKGEVVQIKGNEVLIETTDNMQLWYLKTDVVKIDIDQNELSRKTGAGFGFIKTKEADTQKRKKTQFKKAKNEIVMEVDLHAEKLMKSTRGLDNYDILSLQIETAKRKIEYCIQKKISKIILIHGVGEGVLKTELQYLLNKYPVKYYDASYQKYGLGATEVYVFQNG